jgi:hypothetical protein
MGFANQALAEKLVRQISRNAECLASFSLDQFNHFDCITFLLREVVQGNVSTFPSKGNRYRAPYTGVSPRDQRLATSQAPEPFVALFTMIGCRLQFVHSARRALLLGWEFWTWILGKWILHGKLIFSRHISFSPESFNIGWLLPAKP